MVRIILGLALWLAFDVAAMAECNLDSSLLDTMQGDLAAVQEAAGSGDAAGACRTIKGLAAKLEKASEALRACGDNQGAETISGSLQQIKDAMGVKCGG